MTTGRDGPGGPGDHADPATTGPATTGPAGPVTTVPADPVTTPPADRVVPGRGTAMTTAVTSTGLRGVTDLRLGVAASRRGRRGIDHFRRPVDRGTTGRSTTGATRKRRSGTRSSISSASTSSEFGSRCKDSPHSTPASPTGEAGVALCCAFRRVDLSAVCRFADTTVQLGRRRLNPRKVAKVEGYAGEMRRRPRCNRRAP